jgi:hypothetical protein
VTAPITYAALRTFETPRRTLVLPAPDSVTWNQGIEEQIINESNDFGELIFTESIVNTRQPVVTLNYAKMTKELMALKLGWKLQNQALTDALFCKSLRVQKASYPGGGTGAEGNGMLADQTTSEATVLRDGVSTPLTRQPFATFVAATADSFAQGADGAIKFSDNLIAERSIVTVYFFYPVATADVISEIPFAEFQASFIGVIQEDLIKKVYELKFDSIQLNKQENSEFDFKASPFPISFRITDFGCVPKLRFLNRTRIC